MEGFGALDTAAEPGCDVVFLWGRDRGVEVVQVAVELEERELLGG